MPNGPARQLPARPFWWRPARDTRATFGGLIALQNLINGANPPSIVSISYGECEAENGATSNAAFQFDLSAGRLRRRLGVSSPRAMKAQPVAMRAPPRRTHGIGVSAFASTPYNVAVGGTDFGDTYAGTEQHLLELHQYRDLRLGACPTFRKSRGTIPAPAGCWPATSGYSTTYGRADFAAAERPRRTGLPGGRCGQRRAQRLRHGFASTSNGVVSGTCAGYAKPSWQSATRESQRWQCATFRTYRCSRATASGATTM